MLSVLHSDSAINQEDSLLTILRYQIPTQASVQLCVVNSHGYMSNFTASKDAEVWIVKEEMNRFYIFIVEIYIFFLPFQTAEHNFFFFKAGNATSVCFYHGFCFEIFLCRRNVLPSCLEFQSGYGFSMKYITRVILAGYKQE